MATTNTINTAEVYKAAEKIAALPRRSRRLQIARLCKKYPALNVYDLQDIIALYTNAAGTL